MTKHQFWKTVSNIAYPIAGLWVGEPIFMLLMLGLGIASAYYHAGGRHGNHWDVGAIYVVLFFLIGVGWGIPPIYVVWPAIPAGWALRMKALHIRMEVKIGALMAPVILFGFLSGASLTTATVVLLVALGIRQWVDHGLWQLVSAGGLALVAHALQAST